MFPPGRPRETGEYTGHKQLTPACHSHRETRRNPEEIDENIRATRAGDGPCADVFALREDTTRSLAGEATRHDGESC